VVVPNDVQIIGVGAFSRNEDIVSVVFPSSLRHIKEYAFQWSSNLASITLNEGLQRIEYEAFYECIEYTSIHIPSTVEYIGTRAFAGGSRLVDFDDDIWHYSQLETVTFAPNSSLVETCNQVFAWQRHIVEIELPASLVITSGMFHGCTGLERVTFEAGSQIETIGSTMFMECESLVEITIPATVTWIGSEFARGATSLERVIFLEPSAIEVIDIKAFMDCVSLTTITIPASVQSVREEAFEGCDPALEIIVNGRMRDLGIEGVGTPWETTWDWNPAGLSVSWPQAAAYDDVDAARLAIENEDLDSITYTQAQNKTQNEVKADIQAIIDGLDLDTLYGVTINIVNGAVVAPVAGQAPPPFYGSHMEGTDGSFSFAIGISHANASTQTVEVTIVITATPFSSAVQDNLDIAAAKAAIEGTTFTAPMFSPANASTARGFVSSQIVSLGLWAKYGVSTNIINGVFTPATAGTAANPSGVNGSFTFTVQISKGMGTPVTTAVLTMAITAPTYGTGGGDDVPWGIIGGAVGGGALLIAAVAVLVIVKKKRKAN
jgi:hypothetical protein